MAVLFEKQDTFQGDYFSQVKHFEPTLLHRHDFFEFFYVSAGKCVHLYNGKKILLSPGDAVFLTPRDEHTFMKNNDVPLTRRDILFSLDYFKGVCDLVSPLLYSQIMEKKTALSFHLTNEQMATFENQTLAITLAADKEIAAMMTKSLACHILNNVIFSTYHTNTTPNWILTLISYFTDPAYFQFSLMALTDRFHLSKSYMSRKFKDYTNMTMTDYFNDQKITYAHTLLTSTTFSVEEICNLSGINNPSYFYRLFKRKYKKTPHAKA